MVYNNRMKNMMLSLVLFFTAVSFAAAQSSGSDPSGIIVYAEGSGFDIIRNGEISYVDLENGDDAVGISLFKGDVVNTYDGTFLEIRLAPSRNMVKISENTSFSVKETDSEGGGEFELNYGRVRAKVSKLFGFKRFTITGPTMVAGVRGTDFGYDSVAGKSNDGGLISEVYCFEGSVSVRKTAEEDGAGIVSEPVIIEAGEMAVELPSSENTAGGLKVEAISGEIRDFWIRNDFKSGINIEESGASDETEAASQIAKEAEAMRKKRAELKHDAVWTGISGAALTLGGGFLYYADDLFSGSLPIDGKVPGLGLMAAGGVFMGSSIFLTVSYLMSGN